MDGQTQKPHDKGHKMCVIFYDNTFFVVDFYYYYFSLVSDMSVVRDISQKRQTLWHLHSPPRDVLGVFLPIIDQGTTD